MPRDFDESLDAHVAQPLRALAVAGRDYMDVGCGMSKDFEHDVPPRSRLSADAVVWAMSKVIAMADGDDIVWRWHLGFIPGGLRERFGRHWRLDVLKSFGGERITEASRMRLRVW